MEIAGGHGAIEERFLTAFGMTTPGKNENPKNKGLGREHATSDSGITKSGSFASLWMTKACLVAEGRRARRLALRYKKKRMAMRNWANSEG